MHVGQGNLQSSAEKKRMRMSLKLPDLFCFRRGRAESIATKDVYRTASCGRQFAENHTDPAVGTSDTMDTSGNVSDRFSGYDTDG